MEKSLELLSDIECPFNPMMAQGDGPLLSRSSCNLIRFDDSGDNQSRVYGDESFEALGGNSSVLDPCDLKTEIAQLKFQILKLNEDCADLRKQNSTFQDENILLMSEKDELEKKLAHRDLAQERIKQLQKQLDETVRAVSNIEDLNSILRAKNQRLEKDFWDLEDKDNNLRNDYNKVMTDLEKAYAKIKRKDEDIQRLKCASEDLIEKWRVKQTWLEHQMTDLNETLEEITRANFQLRQEKFELENSLVDCAGNQLVYLNGSIGSPEGNSSRSSSPSSPRCSRTNYASPRSYLGRSLQAEIAAIISNNGSSASTISLDNSVSQSCPVLSEPDECMDKMSMPVLLVTCSTSTQTDPLIDEQPIEITTTPPSPPSSDTSLGINLRVELCSSKLGLSIGRPPSRRPSTQDRSLLDPTDLGDLEDGGDVNYLDSLSAHIGYAFDPVRRCSESAARILTGQEWRTLRLDLDKKAQDNYRKGNEEEGNDFEGGLAVESGSQRPSNAPDLEEEAEECLEKFPGLVEKLFEDLDVIKRTQKNPAEFDLEIISTRFNHLAHTFKVEHSNLAQRKEINANNHDHATTKMEDIVESLSEIVQKFDDITRKTNVPEDLSKLILSFKNIPGDLDIYTHELSKTSRRVGMMDVQVRLYKMIEVMVLYVHILRNMCAEKDKDIQSARKLLDKNSIIYSVSKPVTARNNENGNNNNGKLCNGNHESEFDPDSPDRPTQLLQHLLGPIKSNLNMDNKLVLKEEKASPNVLLRFWSEAYETMRCEFFWPWNGEDTWRGMKEGFSFTLMVLGLFVIFRNLFPSVADGCPTPSIDLGSIFSKHGELHHPALPPI
ncbi:uncharacterized protein LOC110850655 isoform X2 [Folsomia candida]|uniref:uncharacterized protein LOC110850655 isoform X2 n=1 Tax=Folsomia candida TaxID=158441 RepID=UPI000B8F0ED0|nr:uncharacterized protein LOC110850655 isoform X2 [Folsomia candida]